MDHHAELHGSHDRLEQHLGIGPRARLSARDRRGDGIQEALAGLRCGRLAKFLGQLRLMLEGREDRQGRGASRRPRVRLDGLDDESLHVGAEVVTGLELKALGARKCRVVRQMELARPPQIDRRPRDTRPPRNFLEPERVVADLCEQVARGGQDRLIDALRTRPTADRTSHGDLLASYRYRSAAAVGRSNASASDRSRRGYLTRGKVNATVTLASRSCGDTLNPLQEPTLPEPRQLHFFGSASARAFRPWRHPDVRNDAVSMREELVEKARLAEAAKLDGLFFADVHNYGGPATWGYKVPEDFEPFTTAAALGMVTERLGLAVTGSTTLQNPFHLARQFLSLEHLTGGRMGWNVVTSFAQLAADNVGIKDLPSHENRYAMAEEALDLVQKLWDSWEDDAIVEDRESGLFQDPSRIHVPDHHGRFYDSTGPIGARRSLQGRPVIFQAGSSATGRAFAARSADVIFTAHRTLDEAVVFAEQVDVLARDFGRAQRPLITPSLQVTVGATEEEAHAVERDVYEYFSPEARARWLLEFEVDVVDLPLDLPVPASAFPPDTLGHQTALSGYRALAAKSPTVRDFLYATISNWGARVVGSPEQIADLIQDWFETGAVDGFVVGTTNLPGQFRAFTEMVVPVLQSRGLFRRDYDGTTLRDHLGLGIPVNHNRPMNLRE